MGRYDKGQQGNIAMADLKNAIKSEKSGIKEWMDMAKRSGWNKSNDLKNSMYA